MRVISLPLEVPNIALSHKLFTLTQAYEAAWVNKGVKWFGWTYWN